MYSLCLRRFPLGLPDSPSIKNMYSQFPIWSRTLLKKEFWFSIWHFLPFYIFYQQVTPLFSESSHLTVFVCPSSLWCWSPEEAAWWNVSVFDPLPGNLLWQIVSGIKSGFVFLLSYRSALHIRIILGTNRTHFRTVLHLNPKCTSVILTWGAVVKGDFVHQLLLLACTLTSLLLLSPHLFYVIDSRSTDLCK